MDTHYYIISGMGADHRVFSRIQLPENHTHIPWVENYPNEKLESYALRMASKITHSNPVLIGLSFGGIVAQEIAALISIKELILISTIKSHVERPWYMNIAGIFNMSRLIPNFLLKKPNKLMAYAFSVKKPKDMELLKVCFGSTSIGHLRWAVNQIIHWTKPFYTCPIFLITSSEDRIFCRNRKCGHAVIQGGHFAVITHANEINTLLAKKLIY